METDASIAKMGVKLIKQNGVSSYSSKTDIVVSGGKQYAAFSLNVSAEGKYYIGIAPVYEGSDNEVSGYYSADITKLYLYDVADAEENGISESILISADFDGRYYSLSTVKTFPEGRYLQGMNTAAANILQPQTEYSALTEKSSACFAQAVMQRRELSIRSDPDFTSPTETGFLKYMNTEARRRMRSRQHTRAAVMTVQNIQRGNQIRFRCTPMLCSTQARSAQESFRLP